MTEEPYRWLEAITNRREYIEDQLAPGLPVVALSADPGVLLLTIRTSTPKLFEVYDHLALGTVGHPADIEKVRQTAIDAAHLEGFARSPKDVTGSPARQLQTSRPRSRRRSSKSSPRRSFFAEFSASSGRRRAMTAYGGSITMAPSRRKRARISHTATVISGPRQVTKEWVSQASKPTLERDSLKSATLSALKLLLWAKLQGTKDQGIEFSAVPNNVAELKEKLGPDGLEAALLDRSLFGQPITYRISDERRAGIVIPPRSMTAVSHLLAALLLAAAPRSN